MSGSQSLPFSEGNCDGRDIELNFYDRSRKMHRIDEEGFLPMSTSTLSSELCCPICLDLLTNTMTTKECLHRFCAECITTALLRGNKECPTCRKKLVSKRSLRPDPNMDSLIEKLWPDRQIYELMQSKCMEEFTQQNNIDSLRSSIEEGIKAQAANRRQRVTGSYDIGKKERRKREDELAGEPSQSSTPPQEVIFDDVLNEDENNGDSMPMIDVGEDGNSGGSGNSGGEGNGSGRKAAFENGQNGMDCDIGEAEDGGGDESMDDEEEIDEQMMQEWDRLAAEEMLDDIPDDYSSSSSSSDSSSSSNGSSELELSSISDDNTVPAQNGEIEEILRDDDAELPKGTVPLTDRMQKWLAENPNSPPSDEMGDGLERTNEDGLLEIGDGETEIEAQFIPSRSLQERFKEWSRPGTANDINRSRFLKTAHSTTMSHFGQYLWDCYASELGSMAEFQDNQLLVKPQYFYVFNQETGHHIRRIFEEETFLVAHGASSRDHHLQIFFDTIEPKPSSETSLLETVVPPEFLEGKVILQQSEPS